MIQLLQPILPALLIALVLYMIASVVLMRVVGGHTISESVTATVLIVLAAFAIYGGLLVSFS